MHFSQIDLNSSDYIATVTTLIRCHDLLWETFESAYELTQFLRGTLFLTVDGLLGQDYSLEEDIAKAHTFVSKFIQFVVRWLKWMAVNPQTVSN